MPRYGLDGRTVVITGSTGGLGSALASSLRSRGAKLVLLDLDEDALEAQAFALGGSSVAMYERVDVRSLGSLEAAMRRAAQHFGRIDVVIANAGIDAIGSLATFDPAAFERVIDVNLTGVWRTFRAALPHVVDQQGYLLGISSMAAFVHSPLQAHYTASKAGVWALCDSIRLEVRHLGVAVGSAHPTFFQTPMMDAVHADPAGNLLWGGNTKGMWKSARQDEVVASIVDGIERRAQQIFIPKRIRPIAKAPGIFRPFIDRFGFSRKTIVKASAAATPGG